MIFFRTDIILINALDAHTFIANMIKNGGKKNLFMQSQAIVSYIAIYKLLATTYKDATVSGKT